MEGEIVFKFTSLTFGNGTHCVIVDIIYFRSAENWEIAEKIYNVSVAVREKGEMGE